MKININGLGNQVTQDSLECLFETYGRVEHTCIFMKTTAQHTAAGRCAEVTMTDAAAANIAVRCLNGSVVNGQQLQVSLL